MTKTKQLDEISENNNKFNIIIKKQLKKEIEVVKNT